MGKKKTLGRPSIFTKALGDEVLKFLNAGMLVQDAAAAAGIHRDSIYTWVAKGKTSKDPDLKAFSDAVPKARMTAKVRAVASVNAAMGKNWKAAAWWLSVSDPKNYGPKVRVTLDQEFTDALARIRAKVSPEVYEQVLAAVVEDEDGGGAFEDPRGETEPLH
jgi:hypothetical protein